MGHLRVGHNGGGIGVHENDLEPFLPQDLAGLGPGVIEFAGLANNNWPRPNDQNLLDVCTPRHPYCSDMSLPLLAQLVRG